MDLRINLATRYYLDSRLVNLLLGMSVLVLLVLTAAAAWSVATKFGQQKRLTSDIALLQTRFATTAKGFSEKDYQHLLTRISFANSLIAKRSVDWLALLDQVEAVVPEGLSLSSFEPGLKDASVKLTGTARGFRNVRLLVENLEGNPHFKEVFLQSHSDVSMPGDQKGVSFTLTCKVTQP